MVDHLKRNEFKILTIILAIVATFWPTPYLGLDIWIAYMIAYACDEIRAGKIEVNQ